jgi:hypothetical protein
MLFEMQREIDRERPALRTGGTAGRRRQQREQTGGGTAHEARNRGFHVHLF